MSRKKLIECVPNFSEGRDMDKIKLITDEIESVPGVRLLDVDPGKATNRTVVTFVGHPDNVIQAAFLAIKKAGEVLDMRHHSGEHPRMGATDVCPLIPIADISMEETTEYAHKLGKMVGDNLDIPIFMYESAATKPDRKNLATIRSGEYEGMAKKLTDSNWQPDYGKARFNPKSGVTAIGARDFLIAYNVNLNTRSVRRANSVAFDVREKGRIKREGNPITGKIVHDHNGEPMRVPGACQAVKAIGWFIEEYGLAQISMNLTDINITPLHIAFEACRKSANSRGLRVTGSELVGLLPKKVLIDAGKYFLKSQQRSTGVSDHEIIHIAIKSLGLDELGPFDPNKKIIEYLLEDDSSAPLVNMSLTEFVNETSSESPAPGGGSISAYTASLGIALGNMVANLSAHKRGWDDRWESFSDWAEKGKVIQNELIRLVDEDTRAFNQIIEAVRLPKITEEEKAFRKKAMEEATIYAVQVPLKIMKTALKSFEIIEEMARNGNPNSVSDAGVGALCTLAGIRGAYFNVRINCKDIEDSSFVNDTLSEADEIMKLAKAHEKNIVEIVESMMV